MKKILVLAMIAVFSLLIFAVDTSKTIDTEKNVFDYMDANGIEYEINEEGALKELPKDANVLTIEYVQEFIESVLNTKTVTMETYAYADFDNPSGKRLEFACGVDSTASTGYQFKWLRYYASLPGYVNFTKSRFCPGGSGDTSVSYCTETDSSVTTHYADYSEYTACDACDDDIIFRIRCGANLYTTTYVRTWNGMFWVWLPVTVYAGWQYALAAGTPPPYDPATDLCDEPVMLSSLCPYI